MTRSRFTLQQVKSCDCLPARPHAHPMLAWLPAHSPPSACHVLTPCAPQDARVCGSGGECGPDCVHPVQLAVCQPVSRLGLAGLGWLLGLGWMLGWGGLGRWGECCQAAAPYSKRGGCPWYWFCMLALSNLPVCMQACSPAQIVCQPKVATCWVVAAALLFMLHDSSTDASPLPLPVLL